VLSSPRSPALSNVESGYVLSTTICPPAWSFTYKCAPPEPDRPVRLRRGNRRVKSTRFATPDVRRGTYLYGARRRHGSGT